MKFDYEFSKKDAFHYINYSLGILNEKRRIKRLKKKKVKKLTEIIIKNYLLCSALFFLIAFFDTLLKLEWISFVIFFLFLELIIYNTFLLISLIKKYFKYQKKQLKGEIKCNKDYIIDNKENGTSISRTWDEIEFIINTQDAIYLFANHQITFVLPKREKNEEKLEKLEKLLNELPNGRTMITKNKSTGFNKWLGWLFYLLMPVAAFLLFGYWYNFNLTRIETEMQKINDLETKIDFKIYSYEKFGVIEQMLKEYYEEFQNTRREYEQNKASTIFAEITIDLLKNNKEKLVTIQNSLEQNMEKSTRALNHLIDLLDETKVMRRMERKDWGNTFNAIFRSYALTDYDSYYIDSWKKEKALNDQLMIDVKRALEILIEEQNCWYIENDKFFMCDEYREEYNKIHDKIIQKENIL